MLTVQQAGERVEAEGYSWLGEPVGLYIHIPFCESKCIYCDFNSYANMEERYEPFVRALCADIVGGVGRHLPSEPDCAGARVDTVFFGGGTPSVLQPDQIARILDAVRARYNVAADAEVSMEANPGTITLEKFEGYLAAGVNRLSMGVQVLDDPMLKKLGRIHSADGALESYALARRAAFENVNLDFIYGLPGQDLAHLDRMLDRLLLVTLPPEHISCYSLIVEEHTPLYIGVSRGLISVPGEDEVADMYERVAERLREAGYDQYEISNFSRGRPCRHNLIYWHDERYLAFGPGAHGYWGDTRYGTTLGPADYIDAIAGGRSPLEEQTHTGRRDAMGEFMMMGLRLNSGVSRGTFKRRFGTTLEDIYGMELERLVGLGLLDAADDHVRLTARGRLLGNEVFERFI